jgi:hypothetical protein
MLLTPGLQHRDEVQVFLTHQEDEDKDEDTNLADDKWVVKLTYP